MNVKTLSLIILLLSDVSTTAPSLGNSNSNRQYNFYTSKSNKIENSSSFDQHIVKCVINIASKYLEGPLLLAAPSDKSTRELRELHEITKWSIIISTFGCCIKSESLHKANGFIFLLDSDEHLSNLLQELKSHSAWNSRARFVVAVAGYTKLDLQIIPRILNEFYKRSVINVIVLFQKYDTNVILVNIWFPFTSNRCRGDINDTTVIDQWVDGKFSNNFSLFPDKLKNFHGCNLNVSTFSHPPFVMPPIKGCNGNPYYNSGMEIFALQIISEKLNFEINYLSVNDTWVGIVRHLVQGTADIGVGGMTELPGTKKVKDYSVGYIPDTLTWYTPSGRQIPQWQNLIEIFSDHTWASLFLSLILIFLVIWRLASYEENERLSYRLPIHCFLNMFSVLLGHSVEQQPRAFVLRALFCLWVFFSLVVVAAYQSCLVSFLTEPRFEKPVQNLDQILESDLKCGMNPVVLSVYQDDPRRDEIAKRLVTCISDKCAHQMAVKRNLALLGGKLNLAFLSAVKYNQFGKPMFVPFKEPVGSYYVSMAFPKETILLDKFNGFLRRISLTGLIHHWLKSIEHSSKIRGESKHVGNMALTLQNLIGAFMLLLFGVIFALIVFILEVMHSRHFKSKNNRELLH
ncbi:hypothetical protein L9F63_026846 [Diploptera punctata]|uniref:Uncharacterized protein n=1 Tax=Diploptera punctata TaxID=6984 RepID=A0AAD8AG19_DIPPU|nr:hypothetical protein L9F63_026846 [Diploptera punctata]